MVHWSTCPSRALPSKRGSWDPWLGRRALREGSYRCAYAWESGGRGLPELSDQGSLAGRLDAKQFLTFRLSLSRRWPYLLTCIPAKEGRGWGVFPKLLRLLINLLAKARREAPKAKFN